MSESKIISLAAFGVLLLVAGGMYGCPKYNVWQKELKGMAQLKQAEWSRQIKIREAMAEKEGAKFKAEAEVERARGVAEANKIIGTSLKNNESYLRYLWITHLDEGNQVIYIPTEASMPILEAGKREIK